MADQAEEEKGREYQGEGGKKRGREHVRSYIDYDSL